MALLECPLLISITALYAVKVVRCCSLVVLELICGGHEPSWGSVLGRHQFHHCAVFCDTDECSTVMVLQPMFLAGMDLYGRICHA